ncbi:hypothetical protein [Rugamonas aquatica]|uniref:Uncharacterized protein n=1 Tax=Rugamonas aquatica TaxID=2743357 RepID=A0A6A7MUK8_9BURK|nr:hypothetical protein [Rugamonas aquatica]MQA36816.1 hypothetical protein [Rugamonas aquatica]
MWNLYDRMYFSPWRNKLTKTEGKFFFGVLGVIFLLLILSLSLLDFEGMMLWVMCLLCGMVCVFTVLYFYTMWCWTYRKTNMMLSPEGRGEWSTHMGLGVTLFPCFYARVMCSDTEFMDKGRVAIAKAAQAIDFRDTIILKGHLHGLEKNREIKAELLAKALPDWEVTHKSTNETLGDCYARVLTWHRNFYLKRDKQPSKKPLSANRSIGVIELKLKNPTLKPVLKVDVTSSPNLDGKTPGAQNEAHH